MIGTGHCLGVRMGRMAVSMLVLAFAAGNALCQMDSAEEEPHPLLPSSSWKIAFEYDSVDYEEGGWFSLFTDDPSIDGSLYGVDLAWTGHQPDGLMLQLGTGFVGGGLEYDGGTHSGTPVKEDTDDFIWRLRGLIGYDFEWANFALTPYTGIGYRYWNNDVGGPGGYEREIQYLYTPIGVETVAPIGDKWKWGLRGEYDLFWAGTVKSHLSDVLDGLNDLTNDQDDGYGVRGAVYFERRFENVSLGLELFIRYWNIDRSDRDTLTFHGIPVGEGVEPKNDTVVSGFQVALVF